MLKLGCAYLFATHINIELANFNGFSIKRIRTFETCKNQKVQLIIFKYLAPDVFTEAYLIVRYHFWLNLNCMVNLKVIAGPESF
jgi:hypothetical protein